MKRECPICGSKEKERLYSVSFDREADFPLPKTNDIVCCTQCGFAFADNDADQMAYDEYYKKSNDYSGADSIKYDSVDKDYLKIFADSISNLITDKAASIVDVGCGDGGLLRRLKNMGYTNLLGIDPSEASIKLLENAGINGMAASVFDIPNLDISEKYDAIISTGVAEHIYDLNGYVQILSELMNETGRLFIVVPDVEGFSKKYLPLPNYFNHEHINYFSRISLDNLMGNIGLKNISPMKALVDLNGEQTVFGVYIRVNDKELEKSFDYISKESVEKYLLEYLKRGGGNTKLLREFIGEDYFYVWGTGSLAMQMFAENEDLKGKLYGCIDNNKAKVGETIFGCTIESPEKLKSMETYPIVICSMLNSGDIVNQIVDLGLTNRYMIFE